jgi:hypothetical protein
MLEFHKILTCQTQLTKLLFDSAQPLTSSHGYSYDASISSDSLISKTRYSMPHYLSESYRPTLTDGGIINTTAAQAFSYVRLK